MIWSVDAAVVGAGVVGLACARALALAGREVLVLEAAPAIGTGISSRSSEVIHAGLYYPPSSLKARLCVRGRDALYAFCESHGVDHGRIGKLVVASGDGQRGALESIAARAAANGVSDLRWLDARGVAALEPAVRAEAALLSPSTGIVDSHGLMLALQGDAERAGALFALHSRVAGGRVGTRGITLRVRDAQAGEVLVRARALVNAAGLGAQALAAGLAGLPRTSIAPRHLARGHYFALRGRSPFRHLVYPLPEAGGLGVHVTLDLAGQARFGPDVEWVETEDYAVDPARAAAFYPAIRRYFPDLADGALEPAYAGIRPKIVPRGAPPGDFAIQGPEGHGVAGLVNLYGIESPGLTAALAIAEEVCARLSIPSGEAAGTRSAKSSA